MFNKFLALYDDKSVLNVAYNDFNELKFNTASNFGFNTVENLENVYFSPNSLKMLKGKYWRDSSHVDKYECLFCDIDLEHITDIDLLQISTDGIKQYLLDHVLIDDTFAEPTMIINSGHGLHVYWKIEPITDGKKWLSVQKYICQKLSLYGADMSVSEDSCRLLRVPNTINAKKDREPKRVEVLQFNSSVYNIDSLIEEYNINIPTEKIKKHSSIKKKTNKKKYVSTLSVSKSGQVVDFYKGMYQKRVLDLEKLFLMRDAEGSREIILFLYRYYLEYITDASTALEMTLMLNSRAKNKLSEMEVRRATKSANTYHSKEQIMKFSNKKLIEWLQITEEEQKELKSIISKSEKASRKQKYNKKYYATVTAKKKGLSKADVIQIRRTKLLKMVEEGKTQVEICQELDISRRTYYTDLKFAKSETFIPMEEPKTEKAKATGTDGTVTNFVVRRVQNNESAESVSPCIITVWDYYASIAPPGPFS